jgi:hypothetical protein
VCFEFESIYPEPPKSHVVKTHDKARRPACRWMANYWLVLNNKCGFLHRASIQWAHLDTAPGSGGAAAPPEL